MKRFLLLFTVTGVLMSAAELSQVRTVYVLPMAHGLDQYLANRLINGHVFQVVTDPTKADAIFTDRIGESLEAKLSEILPEPDEPQAAAPAPKSAEPKVADAKPTDAKAPAKKPDDARGDISPFDTPVNKVARAGTSSTFGRAQGTVFLVDTGSRQVVWSAYDPPRNMSTHQLDRTATSLVKRIQHDLKSGEKEKK